MQAQLSKPRKKKHPAILYLKQYPALKLRRKKLKEELYMIRQNATRGTSRVTAERMSGTGQKDGMANAAIKAVDVEKRLELGYKAVALKPIAKTMSVSFDMAAAIYKAGGQCLCADLTVVPLLAEWNKQFAARIGALKGMNCGCIEINGNQNYKNWESLCDMLPSGLVYKSEKNGCFDIDENDYRAGAKLFCENKYLKLFE